MYCNECSKLAFFPKKHKCINCPRLCKSRQDKWCSYCSSIKRICAVCGRPISSQNQSKDKAKTRIQKNHPFFSGGCKSCGK